MRFTILNFQWKTTFEFTKMRPKITTIISFSLNDKQFLKHCVDHVLPFSEQVIISCADKSFDGTPYNTEELTAIGQSMVFYDEKITFVEWELVPEMNPNRGGKFESRFWNQHQRLLGWGEVSQPTDWILWLDADEIVDTNRFLRWISSEDFGKHPSYSLANYWYWRDTETRATHNESNTIISRADQMNESLFFKNKELERENFLFTNDPTSYCKFGLNDDVMIHHYSWVRNKEQMLQKVRTWSHNRDRLNWERQVEEEFSHPVNGTNFMHPSYTLIKCQPFITLQP
jgi:hypothetical protein